MSKLKKMFNIFMVMISLVCCLGMFAACKSMKTSRGESKKWIMTISNRWKPKSAIQFL